MARGLTWDEVWSLVELTLYHDVAMKIELKACTPRNMYDVLSKNDHFSTSKLPLSQSSGTHVTSACYVPEFKSTCEDHVISSYVIELSIFLIRHIVVLYSFDKCID